MPRPVRRLFAPQLVHKNIARDGLVCAEQQDDKQSTQLRAANLDHAPVRTDFERPEDPVVDHARSPCSC